MNKLAKEDRNRRILNQMPFERNQHNLPQAEAIIAAQSQAQRPQSQHQESANNNQRIPVSSEEFMAKYYASVGSADVDTDENADEAVCLFDRFIEAHRKFSSEGPFQFTPDTDVEIMKNMKDMENFTIKDMLLESRAYAKIDLPEK